MALSRRYLATLGIEADKIDEIISAHAESLEAVKADRDKYKGQVDELTEKGKKDAEAVANAQKELSELQKQVEADAKDREGKDYDKLKEEFDNYKAEQEAKAVRSAKETALKELLSDMKMSEKYIKMIWGDPDKVDEAESSGNVVEKTAAEGKAEIVETDADNGEDAIGGAV